MLLEWPIAFPGSSGLTSPTKPGLVCAEQGPVSGWVHASFTLDAEEYRVSMPQRWLRALHVSVVTEPDQAARSGRVFPIGVPMRDPFRIEGDLAVAELAFDLSEVLGEAPPDCPYYLHLSAERWVSTPQRRVPVAEPARIDPTAVAPLVALTSAYAHCRDGAPLVAIELFRGALRDEAIQSDLDRPHLFNAACAAVRAAQATADVAPRDALVRQAYAWLEEDAALVAPWIDARRDRIDEHMRARRHDPDLEILRLSGWTGA